MRAYKIYTTIALGCSTRHVLPICIYIYIYRLYFFLTRARETEKPASNLIHTYICARGLRDILRRDAEAAAAVDRLSAISWSQKRRIHICIYIYQAKTHGRGRTRRNGFSAKRTFPRLLLSILIMLTRRTRFAYIYAYIYVYTLLYTASPGRSFFFLPDGHCRPRDRVKRDYIRWCLAVYAIRIAYIFALGRWFWLVSSLNWYDKLLQCACFRNEAVSISIEDITFFFHFVQS